jgi:ATP-dependent protease ClpP protease subunit
MNEKTLCVVFDCPLVNEANAALFIQLVSANLTSRHDTLYLLLNTPGGSVNLGIVIYNFLVGLPVKVITHNIGQVDSIGNVIFVAGEERYAVPSSTFLFHGIVTGGIGGLSVPQMREQLSQLEQDEKRMSAIITDHSNLGPRQLTKFYREGRSIDTKEALKRGVIHDIKEVGMSPTAQRLVIPSQR